nr:hypothetical protein GCM10020093_073280 [Planobispora longispora]
MEKETDAGLVVSGAKVVATGSALTHYNFIAHYGLPIKDRKFALVATAPMDAPGVKLICRPSYTAMSAVMGSPFDYPLSSRLDENDTILVFDKVLIPWENVFVYGHLGKAMLFTGQSGFPERFTFHGCTRLAVKLEFLAGLLYKALEITGTKDFRGCRPASARCSPGGTSSGPCPTPRRGTRCRGRTAPCCRTPSTASPTGGSCSSATRGSGDHPAGRRERPDLRELQRQGLQEPRDPPLPGQVLPGLERRRGGGPGQAHEAAVGRRGHRVRRRHELYERNYAGNHENTRVELLLSQLANGQMDGYTAFVEECLSEYDMDGWTVPDLESFEGLKNFF